ncbi:AAA family ATPase [Phenylobacterium sp.]|uniref:AAA family ATPase n=1 Tax=Phenylobacterium sp. TaxID=1871053 RepID=UPI002FD9874B
MRAQSGHDPFDLQFEADDDFGPSSDADWRPAGPAPSERREPVEDYSPAPRRRAEAFDDLDAPRPAGSVGDNPVHDMIASAEAAFGDHALPRITIHAFIERPRTGDMIEHAARDRRMERTSVTVRDGGLSAALLAYQNQPTPPLLVVECCAAAPELLAQLDQLAEVCDPGSKVVVLGAANDIALYRELMRRGVSEYLVPPLKPLQFVRSVSNLYADPSAPFLGRQIAFCGAKGGVGVSAIAHNIAYAISEGLGANAVLVDLDLPFGTAGLDFNQDPLQGVADALGEPDRLDPVLMDRMMARCGEKLSLFAAPASLDDDYNIPPEAFEEVTQKVRAAAPFVILDLPHVWTAWKRRILLSSDDLVIVATPDLASLRNTKNLVDLVRRARPNDTPPRLVLNQVGVPGRPEIAAKDFGEALGLIPALVVPFEPKLFGQAANNGQMLAELAPKAKTTEALAQLAQQISRREAPVAQKSSLLAGLLRRK